MSTISIKPHQVRKFSGAASREEPDLLAREEPLEIRLEYGPSDRRLTKSLSVTMRTPGADADLVAGFLFTEGIVRRPDDIESIRPAGENVALAVLHPGLDFDMQRLERHFYTTSSCGVCGKTSIEAVRSTLPCPVPQEPSWTVDPETVYRLPALLRQAQDTFEATGGLHAAAFFSREGTLLAVREDVGRHNALDKLVGHCLQSRHAFPLDRYILLLSGRASFELLQKAAMAGVRTVCAVGAPSSLAVETAAACGITLIGFLRDNRFNLYHPSV
jgi:FdhD protein